MILLLSSLHWFLDQYSDQEKIPTILYSAMTTGLAPYSFDDLILILYIYIYMKKRLGHFLMLIKAENICYNI